MSDRQGASRRRPKRISNKTLLKYDKKYNSNDTVDTLTAKDCYYGCFFTSLIMIMMLLYKMSIFH